MAKNTNKANEFDLLTSIKMTDVEREALRLKQNNKSLKHYMIIAIILSLTIGFGAGVAATYRGVSAATRITEVQVKVDTTSADPLQK